MRKKNRQADLTDETLGCFGYGDGGGGCTYQMVERLRRYEKLPGLPRVKNGTASRFFRAAERAWDELPVWDGEMYYENHRGTFTSQAFVKENNRKGEFLMRDIELLGMLAGGYDKERYEALWRMLLVNQFHDILPGSSIHEVFENTRKEYAAFRKEAGGIKEELLRRLSAGVADGNSVVVWNLLPQAVSGPVAVEVPAGITGIEGAKSEIRDGVLTFIAENVPAVGCKRFLLAKQASFSQNVTAEKGLLENEFLRVIIAPNGDITSVYDKENNREVLVSPGNRMSASHDKPIHESAWNLEKDYQLHMDYLNGAEVEVSASSPVRGAVKVTRRYHDSVITQEYVLYAGAKRLDFVTHTDWHEREKVLKAEFPVCVRARYSTFHAAHGALQRPTFANDPFETAMFECCAHQWVDLSEADYGVAILNNCKYGHDIAGNLMRITLMRGPICPDPKGDIGEQDFVYSLYPHAGSWSDAGVGREARKLNQPLAAIFCAAGNGECAEGSYLSVSAPNVTLEAYKAAQDGKGIILRVNETEQRRTQAFITLSFTPAKVYETNLMEENEREVPFTGTGFAFSLKPFEVKTFRIVR